MKFSQNIAFLIKERRISQKELAELIEKSPATVNDYANGRSLPTMEGLLLLADFFKVKLDSLVYSDLQAEKYTGVQEPQEKYHISPKKSQCFLTGQECVFTQMNDLREENTALKEENNALKGRKK